MQNTILFSNRIRPNIGTFTQTLLSFLLGGLILLGGEGCQRPKAMDVLWSGDLVDDNGLARNPVWSAQNQSPTHQPPSACDFCPCGSEDPNAWLSAANCTDQTLQTNSSLECFGHWNWFPVEYEGIVTWGGHSNSWYDDDDYWMGVTRSDHALEVPGEPDGLHIEFDSEETVDYWDDTNTWWDDFHHNYVDDSDQAASCRINGKFVIIIGMLGIDSQHSVPSELNPVYAMFVHVQDDPANDQWAFFVKNWGNEGFCGDNQEYMDGIRQNTLKIRIPHPGASSFTLVQNVWVYGDDEDERKQQNWTYQAVPTGALLTFQLRDPSKQVGFVGDLTFTWAGGKGSPIWAKKYVSNRPTAAIQQPRVPIDDEDGNAALKAKAQRLAPAAQQQLYAEVQSLTHHPRCVTKQGAIATSPAPEPAKPSGHFPNYGSIVRSVKDPARRARNAKARELVQSFLKAHGIE